MKVLLLISLFFSFTVYANLEHREGQGDAPAPERLSRSRGCFKEIKTQGCGHPRENQDFFSFCLQLKIESLSDDCQAFFTRLYGRKI